MLVNHNAWTYPLVIVGKYVVGYVGVGAVIYFFVILAIFGVPGISNPFSILVEVYGLLEILWYFLWFLPFKARLQRPGLRLAPMTKAQRRAMITALLDTVPDVRLFVRKWFNMAHLDEIYKDDVKDWMLWALWGTDSDEGVDPEEMEEYIEEAEIRAKIRLQKGRGGAKPIRINHDPVKMTNRSLFWYGLMFVADHAATFFLMFRGFSFWRQPRSNFFSVFPLRLMTLVSMNESAAPQFSYFFRRGKSQKHRTIVFVHGIGIGVPTYTAWLAMIPDDIGVLVLEVLPISGRICPEMVSNDVVVESMRKILMQQNIDDFVYVGHSYGTFMARPLLDDPVIRPKINSLALFDPVAILLHLPEVAYNITRRKPKYANEIEICWGAARDPMTAHTICRRFNWQEHILMRENWVGKRTTAVVASRDCVIHPQAVASYVYYGDVNYTSSDFVEWKRTPEMWTGRGEIELFYLDDRDHGQSLLISSEMKRLTKIVEHYARKDLNPDPRLDDAKEMPQESLEVQNSRFSEWTRDANVV